MAENEINAPAPRSKTAFVLAQPTTMSAKEISERAKDVGLVITPAYVYVIRNNEKKRASKGVPPIVSAGPKPAKVAKTSKAVARNADVDASADEKVVVEALRSAAYILGLPRAIEILRVERDRIESRFGVDAAEE